MACSTVVCGCVTVERTNWTPGAARNEKSTQATTPASRTRRMRPQRLGKLRRQGRLHKYMLARPSRGGYQPRMRVRPGGNQHRLDLASVQHRLNVVVRPRPLEFSRKALRGLDVLIDAPHQAAVRSLRHRSGQAAAHLAAPDERNRQWGPGVAVHIRHRLARTVRNITPTRGDLAPETVFPRTSDVTCTPHGSCLSYSDETIRHNA